MGSRLSIAMAMANVARVNYQTNNIHRMPERCRILVPVSKGNRGNKKKI
jgi:hypothetical protein